MEKMKSNKDKRFRSYLMSVLRKASRFWAPARQCLVNARLYRGIYKCASCSKEVGPKEIKIDHINPVIPIEGFKSWDEVVDRLFCELEGYQAICKTCHDAKTSSENDQRRICKKKDPVIEYPKRRKRKNSETDP
jgi:5-methylcytosine-specific restriction endonuclease McrA